MGGQKSRRLSVLSVMLGSQPAALILMLAILAVRRTPITPGLWLLLGVLAGISGLAGLAALYRAMAIGVVGIVAAIAATAPIVPVLAGLLRGERPTVWQLGGIGLALLGVTLLAFDHRQSGGRGHIGPGVGLAIFAALAFGVFLLALRDASQHDALAAVLVTRASSVVALGIAAIPFRSRIHLGRGDMPGLILIGLLDVAANIFYGIASTGVLLSLVSILASLYPVVTVLLARTLLKERLGRPQQVGLALAFGGVLLISL